MRGMRMIYKIAAHSDVGIVKKTNQDSVLVKIAQTNHDKVCLCVVCDGMGGLADGELASATVIREFDQWQAMYPIHMQQKALPLTRQNRL